jgi:hypothetical protein
MKKMVVDNKLPAIKEADNKIQTLSTVVDAYRQSDELRKLELEFKMSENYKLELQRDIKIKEIDMLMKEIDSKIQREKNRGIAMMHGRKLRDFDVDDLDLDLEIEMDILDRPVNDKLVRKQRRRTRNEDIIVL